jgi:hypothetical protein
MKKLLGIIVLGLLFCTLSYSHDEEKIKFVRCIGDFPSGLSSIYNDEIIKIDIKQSKIIFDSGYEYISKRKKGWDVEAHDFDSYGGVRTGGTLDKIDHEEYFNINRFTGEGMFYYAKTKKSKWKLIEETKKVKCTKVDRAF